MELGKAVLGHWTGSNQAWKDAEVYQRNESGLFFTEGPEGLETRVFEVDQRMATGSLFPQTRAVTALVQDALYLGLTPAHKVFTAAGNSLLMVVDLGSASRKIWKKETSLRDGMEPVVSRWKQIGKDAVVIGLPAALGYYNCTYLKYAAMGVAGLYGAYSLYNPREMKYQISRLEGRVLPAPLNDSQLEGYSGRMGKVFSVLDGRYSLARFLGMHCMGTTTDKVSSDDKFEFVEKKKAE
ncbi:MAG: hypothetical protein P0S96_04430 [Simkaniaceae bacterium]|nr:hypothetical protein [Candidatus Sacchlamyda saccharinae]